jgi:hypothetical protein
MIEFGTWTQDKPSKGCKGCSVWTDYSDGIPLKVATVHRHTDRMSHAEYETNIRLITLAPKLQSLLSVLCKDRAITRATTEAFKARDEARQVLAFIENGENF